MNSSGLAHARPLRLLAGPAHARTALRALLAAALCIGSLGAGGASAQSLHAGGRARAAGPQSTGAFEDAAPRYHDGETLVCADCHLQHGTAASSQPADAVPGHAAGLAAGFMLKYPDPLDVCLSCHDGSTSIPDVVGGDTNGLQERSAGCFGEPGLPNPRGHDLGRGLQTRPDAYCARCHGGAGGDRAVTCIDCHDPHGNGHARNLRWASDPGHTPDLGLFVDPAAAGLARYESRSVSFGTLASDALREVTSMCYDCHHGFSGAARVDPSGNGIHVRHPSYDSEHGSMGTIASGLADGGSRPEHWRAGVGSGFETDRVRWVVTGATNYAAGNVVNPAQNGVFCLSCHRAHGSAMAFGLAWQVGSRGATATGCDQCHAIVSAGLFPGSAR